MHYKRTASKLEGEVNRVLAADNCSGCGVCVLVSKRITVDLNTDGFMKPEVHGVAARQQDLAEAATFARVCPGVNLRAAAPQGRRTHPVFGSYVDAWQGWAVDPEFRHSGASGGVLTALAHWLVSTGQANAVAGSQMSITQPTRTVPIEITSRDDALAAAGSRYAPVANTLADSRCEAFIGKPCEVSGRFQLALEGPSAERSAPIFMSFFCAGTPSQSATEELTRKLGVEPADAVRLRYRGNGWPGSFEVQAVDGRVLAMSYEESWGQFLGKRLQSRCKLCPDGTGEHADIAIGDYWASDEGGFPVFSDGDGNSVIIARTDRGAALLVAASSQGVIDLEPVDLDKVAAVQPLQEQRRRTLAGRLIGRRLAGRRIPRYRGYNLIPRRPRDLAANARAAAGTFTRSTGIRR